MDLELNRGPIGPDEIGLPQLDQLAAQPRTERFFFAGQQVRRIEHRKHAANRSQLRAQRPAFGFGRMGREHEFDVNAT